MQSGPFEEATGADAATSNPERNSMPSNPFGLPGITRQRQTVCAAGKEDEEKIPAGGGERAEETGGTGAEDEWRLQRTETIEESSGCGKRMESTHEGVTAPTAAQEAFHEVSSHASGEAWPNQSVLSQDQDALLRSLHFICKNSTHICGKTDASQEDKT
ncbi:hypothetical protein NDU88_002975 [Pleurodeles waltl]|uniref:Uncharacterized protein n=1 Tax=Pleurodeles waltl TaxID=8319 RepID=A0AAV7TM83_PLEWA|nr:hypothetical protein NDU88_002975 [Pleurodeles waltl]